ncbi:MAG: AAA domain-containing protein, partial [Bacteroidota bacterium]
VAIWGSAAQRQQTRADLHWVLRRRRHRALPPNETRVQTAEVQLESAWLELRRQEEMVEYAAQAGERLAALGKELDEAAAGIPSSLLVLVEREARRADGGPVQTPGSATSGFDGLGKDVEGFMLEAERVAAGRWHWSERLWPWQRRRRALARLEVQVRSLLHGAGLNSGDWFAAPLPGDAEGMLKSLRLLRAAVNYADLLGRYKQLEQQAGAGAWDAPEGLPSRLAERWAALATAAGTAARARRDWELDSLPEQAVDQLELLLQLQAELVVAAPGSPAEQELERALGDSFVAALEALPVWIVPLAGASEPLPQRPALFDLLVVVGAERIPLAVTLPFAARATSVVMVGDARSEAEALGEWAFERWGSKSEKQELAATCGLRGRDYVLRGWPVASLRWLRQKRAGAAAGSAATGPGRYLRYRAFPLGQVLSRLYFGESLMPAGRPAGGFAARSGISALRWDVTRGEMGSPDSGSAFNLDEAEAVVGLLGKWLDALHRQAMESAEWKPLTIAVVTLFGRQRELLLHKLAALLPDGYEELAEVSVLRVDELAGRRFDVVLASTVLAGEYPAAHQAYLAQHPEFVYALLAAARLSLTVVGDPTAIRTLGGVWSELVDALVKVNAPDSSNGIASVNARGRLSAGPGRHPGRQPEGQKAGAAAAATAAAAVDRLAAPAEELPAPDSFIAQGPYPPGSRGLALAYQELYLMQNGWHGQRVVS